jgi:signal transduction histidine kinase
MSRLPPIIIEGRPCALPLSEPTASALLLELLCRQEAHDQSSDPKARAAAHAALTEALTLDPSLALWTAIHHASFANADSEAPSIIRLAVFLVRRLAEILSVGSDPAAEGGPGLQPVNTIEGPGPDRRRRIKGPSVAADPCQALAKLVATTVLKAQQASSASGTTTDPRYLSALLAGAGAWLAEAGLEASSANALPGWLGRLQLGAAAAPVAGRKAAKKKSRAQPTDRSRPAAMSVRQRAQAKSAGDRWLVPASMASQQFATLAARLARLADLEAHFAERLLEEKLHALGEFAAGAGHEINNPLAVISGRAQLFLRHEVDPDRRRELAVINTQARRVHEMIADLMLFARPPQPRPGPCDAPALVAAVIAELAPRATERNVTLRSVVASASLPTISADATQFQVALRAVIENALDAAPDGGVVEVTIELRDRDPQNGNGTNGNSESAVRASDPSIAVGRVATTRLLAITVRDDGPGIDAAGRRNLFDPFYSGRGAGRGIGMGLSKCWRIITAHGGRVEIDNRQPAGACVTMLLPLLGDI